MGYATPVLAERAHIADRAQKASVRRTTGEGPARVLADAVAERLRARNVDPASVEWDAWRREDGRWTLVADYLSGGSGRHAEFVFDAPGRFVVAEDGPAGPPVASTGSADWMATQASARPVEEPVELGSEADEPAEAAESEEPDDEPPARAAKKSRRPSVPSWDEIMFGGGKRE